MKGHFGSLAAKLLAVSSGLCLYLVFYAPAVAETAGSATIISDGIILYEDGRLLVFDGGQLVPILRGDGGERKVRVGQSVEYLTGELVVLDQTPYAVVDRHLVQLKVNKSDFSFRGRHLTHLSDHFFIADGIPYVRNSGPYFTPVKGAHGPLHFGLNHKITHASDSLLVVNDTPYAIIQNSLVAIEVRVEGEKDLVGPSCFRGRRVTHLSDHFLILDQMAYFRNSGSAVFQPVRLKSGAPLRIRSNESIVYASEKLLAFRNSIWTLENGELSPVTLDGIEGIGARKTLQSVSHVSDNFLILDGTPYVRRGPKSFESVTNKTGGILSLNGHRVHHVSSTFLAVGKSIFAIQSNPAQLLATGLNSVAGLKAPSRPAGLCSILSM